MIGLTDYARIVQKSLEGANNPERKEAGASHKPRADHRYDHIIRLIHEGRAAGKKDAAVNKAILKRYKELDSDTLNVYRLIYDGKTANLTNSAVHRGRPCTWERCAFVTSAAGNGT